MSSLADAPDLVGFFSYSREDDEDSGRKLSKLRERIQAELRVQLGRTRKDFGLWQDKVAIAHGELWEDTIKKGISESVFFIPIITPTAVRSSYCKFEFESFLAREKELDRNNLIFPILYVPVPALTDDRWRQDPLLAIIGSRQYEQWQNLRQLDPSSTEVALRVEKFCANICRALEQEWLSPEERREAEARRAAEAERRRQQEAEIKQRADEEERRRKAEAEQRRRDEEERRRQEVEDRRRLHEAEAEQRRQDEERSPAQPTSLLQIPTNAQIAQFDPKVREVLSMKALSLPPQDQRQVKPWLLPLVGAVAASLVILLFLVPTQLSASEGYRDPFAFNVTVVMIYALYGGAAGMLVQRFGMPKAVAIPIIPAVLLFLVLSAFYIPKGLDPLGLVGVFVFLLVLVVMGVLLVFWLHSLWARKYQMAQTRPT